MNNLLRSKTRLAFIQIIFENLSTKNDIFKIFKTFNLDYKSTIVKNFHDNGETKFDFNSNFLEKLIFFYSDYTSSGNCFVQIDQFINFNRKFNKWDLINQSILLAALSELHNIDKNKLKIVLNDYLNVGKSFVDDKEIGIINAILDKIIYDKK